MTLRSTLGRIVQQEDLNFLLTNRIPRRALTQFVGWLSKSERPWVRDTCMAIWQLFTDLNLQEAKQTRFRSVHDCFTRELNEGARPIDCDVASLVSPSDGIVGAMGTVEAGSVLQAKGFPYRLMDLLGDEELVNYYRDGRYITLRLTAGMYHRFHAPYDCRVEQVTYFSGDTWNINPIALRRIEQLFCKNERAAIRCRLHSSGEQVTLVAVAAVLVASIRLRFLDVLLHLKYRGPNLIQCDATLRKGEEMGWFQHGSTIIVLAPARFEFSDGLCTGTLIRMGQPLMRLRAVFDQSASTTPQP
jgi:phosphatidylserine decarboxylase